MNENINKILNENLIGSLATVNEDGSPWITPLHLVADENGIYWFSGETAQHSTNIARDSRVSVALPGLDTSNGLEGVYLNGSAQLLGEDDRQKAANLFKDRLGSLPPAFQEYSAYFMPFGTLNGEKSTGNCWYFYN